jgi:two-component system, cell cycle sensor histidine kinase and response regulator CckA
LARNSDITLHRALASGPMRVLLVEDDRAEARFLQTILQTKLQQRLQLLHVQRLGEALDALTQQSFDVVLLDLSLPDSQGIASLDQLLQQQPQLPVVVLTNTNDDHLAVEAVRHGAQDYLLKRQLNARPARSAARSSQGNPRSPFPSLEPPPETDDLPSADLPNADMLVRSLCYAIERQHTAEALQAANDHLEQRVQARTAELAATNALLSQAIAERQRLEAQFLRAQRLESVGNLAAGIAHDMNNIFTPILAVSELLPLKEPNLTPSSHKLLHVVEDSARRGSALVKQILAFARGVEGRREPLAISSLLDELVPILRPTLPKHIDFQVTCPPQLSPIQGDVTQLHQVLMNLCVNARDAMPQGGQLRLAVSQQQLEATACLHYQPDGTAKPGPYIVLSVTDTGIGMPTPVLEQMFDPFFSTKPVGQGTGLGLSAVLGIVKSHGGLIDVQSQVGSGTTIQVWLPATPAAVIPTPPTAVPPVGQQQLVLVVDDEAAIRDITKATLESYHYRVLTAANGPAAIALCQEYDQNWSDSIQLLLLDLMMPDLDGFALLPMLQPLCPKATAIAMSGLSPVQMVQRATAVGFQQFLAKPFTTQELLQTLQTASTAPKPQ